MGTFIACAVVVAVGAAVAIWHGIGLRARRRALRRFHQPPPRETFEQRYEFADRIVAQSEMEIGARLRAEADDAVARRGPYDVDAEIAAIERRVVIESRLPW